MVITFACWLNGTGEIPASFGQLTNLTWLSLSRNQLHGKTRSGITR